MSATTDVLASRYASEAMVHIWSLEQRYLSERQLWIAVMKSQRDLGVEIPPEAIQAYESVQFQIDLPRIEQRERLLLHDVKARIEEFCDLAGHQHIHKGMTSRDLTDNVEQLQIIQSIQLIVLKTVSVLHRLSEWAFKYRSIPLVARTHNVPAQPTTVGKRLAMYGQELLMGLSNLEAFLACYPLRGLQGAVGTQLDQWTLLDEDVEALERLNGKIREHLGFSHQFYAVGQVYPRSLDYDAVSRLYALSAPLSSFAKTLRLMAGQSLASEGFRKGQVGSSAMPHKTNARSSERICGLHVILNGFLNMLMGISGDQWNEGDVSCSVVRRVALPGAFYAMDGALETTLTVLEEMGFFDSQIQKEYEQQLPFLMSTSILMACVQKGGGREEMHELVKVHALAAAQCLEQGQSDHRLFERIAQDARIPLSMKDLTQLAAEAQTGCAVHQVDHFINEVQDLLKRFPEARSYQSQMKV